MFLTLATTLAITLCEVRHESIMQHFAAVRSTCLPSILRLAAIPIRSSQIVSICNAQYVPNAPPGYHGTTLYFYSRIVDICLGARLHHSPRYTTTIDTR